MKMKAAIPQTEKYAKRRRQRSTWKKVVMGLGCVVVFCTTYALILPGITMEKRCDIEEHVHSEECYSQVVGPEISVLSCDVESLNIHTHTEECSDASGQYVCGLADYVVHEHTDICYENDSLICKIPEYKLHVHEENCYAAHTHDENCKTSERGALICTQQENDHVHEDTCNALSDYYVCGEEEIEGHTHTDACKEIVKVCGIEPHAHTDACYEVTGNVTCGMEEGASILNCIEPDKLHTHDVETCYTYSEDEDGNEVATLTCSEVELKEHIHDESCFTETLAEDALPLVCALEESEEHTHGAECYSEDVPLTCTLEENEEHSHGDNCYGYWELTCEKTEHEHTSDCDGFYELSENDRNSIEYVIDLIEELPTYDEYEAKLAEYEDEGDFDGEEAYQTLVYELVQDAYRVYSYLDDNEKDYVHNADKLMEFEFIWSAMTLASDAGISWTKPTITSTASTKDFIELNLYNYNSKINTDYFWQDSDDRTKDNNLPGFQWNGGAYMNSTYTYDIQMVDFIDFGNSIVVDGEYGSSGTGTANGKSINAVIPANVNKTNINKIESNDTWGTTNRPIGMSLNSSITDTSEDVLKRVLTPAGEIMTLDGSNNGEEGLRLGYLFNDASDAVTKVNTESVDGLFQYDDETGMYSYNSRLNHAQYDADDYDKDGITDEFIVFKEIITPNFIVYPFGNFLPFNKITSSSTSTQVGSITSGLFDNFIDIFADYHLDGSTGSSQVQLRTMLQKYRTEVENNRTGKNGKNAFQSWSAKDAINDYFLGGANDNYDDKPSSDTSPITDELLNKMYNIDYDVATDFWFSMTMEMDFYQPRDGMTGKDKANDGIGDYEMVFDFSGDDDVWVYVDGVLFLDLTGIHRHVGGKIDFHNGTVQYYALEPEETGDTTKLYKTYTFKEILTEAYKYKYRNTYSGTELTNYVNGLVNDALDFSETNNGRFKDYTIHNFKFYYIERGSGSSVCRMNFNFPMLEQNTVTVKKELDQDNNSIGLLGNPDFAFQVLDIDDEQYEEYMKDGLTAEEEKELKYGSTAKGIAPPGLFVKVDWAYKLTDVNGTILQDMVIEEIYPDGTVKTLNVYKGEYQDPEKYPSEQRAQIEAENAEKLLRTETWQKDVSTGQYTVTKTNYPDNGKILTTDINGIFKLKAGQSAQFVGITENWGRYFVRELMTPDLVDQYENENNIAQITVSTNVTTSNVNVVTGEVEIDKEKYIGFDSPIYNIATHTIEFAVTNKVTTNELGSLSITKKVDSYNSVDSDKEFKFYVELDGEKLGEGKPYVLITENENGTATFNGKKVTWENKTIDTGKAGQIILKAGQTAIIGTGKVENGQLTIISNIIAGSEFKVYEDAGSAEGYNVSHMIVEDSAKDVDITEENGVPVVTGLVKVGTTVSMVTTNSEMGTEVTIPGSKSVYYSESKDVKRIYSFKLTQVADSSGTELSGMTAHTATKEIEVIGDTVTNFDFTLAYVNSQFTNIPENPTNMELQKFYYKITEEADSTGYTIIDPSIYIAEITVSLNTDGSISATLTGMWKYDNAEDEEPTELSESAFQAAFTNTLTGDLTIKKEVEGGSNGEEQKEFNFQLKLEKGDSNITIPDVIHVQGNSEPYPVVKTDATDDTEAYGTVTFTLKHNQTITFLDLPHGMEWTVTEIFEDTAGSGYLTTNKVQIVKVIQYDDTETPVEETSAEETVEESLAATGYIIASSTEITQVIFTNKVLYTLPETGGTGTMVYIVSGLLLTTVTLIGLIYNSKRRKGVF